MKASYLTTLSVSSENIFKTALVILGVIAFLIIAWSIAAIWGLSKSIFKKEGLPKEAMEMFPNSVWNTFREVIGKGIEWLDAMPRETVKIKARDSVTLYGDLFEQAEPKATIIMFHGYRSSGRYDFSCAASFYNSLGYNILMVDQRACGRSGGKYIGFGALERYDCKSWTEYVCERYGKELPIIITGMSMGASTVLMASSLGLPENVVAIVADCGFTSPHDILAHVIRATYHIPPNIILPAMSVWSKILAGYSFKEASTCKALTKNKIPIFMAHGEADDFVPCEMTRRALEVCTCEKEVLYVKNAGHGECYLHETERYQKMLTAFLERQLDRFYSRSASDI